jgi:uncharacterized membrane protein YgcG
MLPLLTPAEVLVLLHGKNANFKELIKMTLMDLLLRKVLAVKLVSAADATDEPMNQLLVQRGARYADYRPLAHEEIYTIHFAIQANREILFANLIKLARLMGANDIYLRRKIMKTPQMRTAFKQGFWANLTDKVQYTQEGLLKRTYAATELQELTNMLPELYEADKATVVQLLQLMHGNIFLTNAVEHRLLMLLDDELSRLFHQEQSSAADIDELFYMTEAFNFESSFDDGFDSGGSDGDSSDGGGDSGCGGGCSGGD